MIKQAIRITLAVALFLLCTYCANIKAPGGGPQDFYPPQVEESDPPNYSTNFGAQKITLKFNEFVSVSDVSTEVFISPPMESIPDIKTKGKSVIITIDEELHDSTTYSIFFGKAIKDITEGNALENYTYVFSTGDRIDSLSVVGEVIDAFNLNPREDVLVMLYEDNNDTIPFDSLPYMVKPSYLTRTSPEGFFVINNMKEGVYRLFALADNNLSSTYDNSEEEIAFLDSLISPTYLAPVIKDSLFADSLAVADSILPDLPLEEFYTLFMFKESETVQRLLSADKPRKRVLRFIFRYGAEDVQITPLTPVSDSWMASEWNKDFDTLRYYILDESMDTISLKISMDTIVYDTASYTLNEEKIPLRAKERKEKQVLTFSTPRRSIFPYFQDYIIASAYPIINYDFSRFLLVEGEDTLQPLLVIHGQVGRKINLDHELKENTGYTLFFPDSVMTDLLGRSNDTTEISFNTNSYEDYGLYKIHITNNSPYDQLLIQLLSEGEKVLREEVVQQEGTISWDYLPPGKYLIKANGDVNKNAKWDSGSFLDHRQPEPVVYNPELIEVREGWSFDVDWAIEFK